MVCVCVRVSADLALYNAETSCPYLIVCWLARVWALRMKTVCGGGRWAGGGGAQDEDVVAGNSDKVSDLIMSEPTRDARKRVAHDDLG